MASTFGDYVLGLYAAIYKRAPDKVGYEYWAKTSDLNAVAAAFAKHPQWATDFPSNLSDAAYVDKIYTNILGIQGDSGGRAYWTDLISRNVLSRSSMVAGFVQAVLDFNPTSGVVGTDLLAATFAANTLGYKISFSKAWLNSSKAVASGVDTVGTAAYQESIDMLNSVKDETTLTIATNSLNNSTFVLTAGTDNIIGSNFSDLIVGDFNPNINNINISDQINGSAGVDTLKMYSAATTAALPLSILNVEVLQFVSPSIAAGVTLDTTKINGLTKVEITEANSNIATSTALPVIKTGNGVGLQLSTATNTTAPGEVWETSATDSSLELTLNGFGRAQDPNATLLLANETATTLTLNSIGGFNGITLVSTNTLANDIIKGSKDLRLTQTPAMSLKSVDASQATGNLQIDLSAGNQISSDFTFKGGVGNDKLVLSGTQLSSLTAATQLNAGEGAFDVLQLSDSNFTPAVSSILNAMLGFEWLSLASVSKITLDVSTLSTIKNIGIAATANTVTISGASASNNFLIDNSQAHDTLIIGNQTGQTAATITLDNGSGVRVGTAALTVNVANAINLNSTGIVTKTGGANSVTTLTVVDNATVTIGGDTDLTLSKISVPTSGVKVDASKFKANLMLESSDKVDTLIGGSGNDTLSGGLGADSLTGGGGADSFVIKPTVATGAGDSITDFSSGTDRLVLKKVDFTTLASSIGTGFSTATDFVTLAGGVATAATDRIIFDPTSKTVYYDSDGSGSTAAVAIVTLVGQTVTASDFMITA